MAARSIASLTVSFGLVSIPVKLYSATEASRAISFNLLHKGCGSRLKQQYVCVKEEVVVPREDMVKGYEFANDQYVMFTAEELRALEEAGSHTAEITEFVPVNSIDPVFFDKAYYLAPDKGGAKPYALLAKALSESSRCAVGRWAARGKQYIVVIRALEDGLIMQQLLYAAEVRSIKEIEIPKTEVKDAELKLAQQLIEQQTSERFDPGAYNRRGAGAHRSSGAEEGRRSGDHDGRGARRGRPGDRSHGGAAREPREAGGRERQGPEASG
jgi:DNA end-binding protein Ku